MDIQLTLKSEQKSFIEIARERVSYYGGRESELSDLLALIVGNQANPNVCYKLSSLSIRELLNLTQDDIRSMGFSKIIAERIYATILFTKKVNSMSLPEMYTITSSEDAYHALKYMQHYDQEVFTVLALDTKNQIIGKDELFKGSLNSSIVHPRETFRFAIRKGAATILVAHNHPSGVERPSREDIEVTKRLAEVGKVIGITLLDHLIIGDGKYFSHKEMGYI
ncbi:DNA repair protein RadC [Heyndrickxia oleronia]|uniref:JAB domain-containing protein n=1 Tax=Heyndrickxia oleronia TaxID=38875 RepID=UPI00333D8114